MRTEQDLRPYQQFAVNHIIHHKVVDTESRALFLGVGLGKTVSTLTSINYLKYDQFEVDKVLIIAPKRVAESVWHVEAKQWTHLTHLTFSLVLGHERKRKESLKAKADIYVINVENVVWLLAQFGGRLPFDMLVIDESSKFKAHDSARFKALKIVAPQLKRIVNLTGTPMPNGLLDLWSQTYLLDRGNRLGKTIGGYRDKYFNPGRRNGHVIYDYKLKKEKDDMLGEDINEREIYDKLSDICISMRAEDYLDLPKRTDQIVSIDMPPELKKQYEEFEETQVLAYLDSLNGGEITAINAASLTGKLLQFANGAIYTGDASKGRDREFYEVHNLKIDALRDALEAANGDPMLIFYQFQSDIVRIQKHLKEFDPYLLDPKHTLRDIESWNRKEKTAMLLHSKSAGHGLNLQFGGHLIWWFGRPWSTEEYDQGVGRVDRSGQKFPVFNWSGVMRGTMDEDVISTYDDKSNRQNAMLNAVKARVDKYRRGS